MVDSKAIIRRQLYPLEDMWPLSDRWSGILHSLLGFEQHHQKGNEILFVDNRTIITDEGDVYSLAVEENAILTDTLSGRIELLAVTEYPIGNIDIIPNRQMAKWDLPERRSIVPAIILRYPWDVFCAFRHVLSACWERILHRKVDKWKLREWKPGVWVSKDARIDDTVQFNGSAVIGPGTIIKGHPVIGKNVFICGSCNVSNFCKIAKYSFLSTNVTVGHGAEISGVFGDGAMIPHVSYIRGVMDKNSNIGGGTWCGTSRFDGQSTRHVKNCVKEVVFCGANEVYIGPYARTGANSTLLPGTMLGRYSAISPGTVFSGKLNDEMIALPKQGIYITKKTGLTSSSSD